ncbi:hypothetical protein [uncultured Paludibaculum sp.]|uniref:hypothetical protein n=1 Tax=uncultured Paludibaculum sp. TaxID=1765020 RepID=UPI002AAB1012|nr:hypothetical protein [uncultured Paludibaculum sp.]
MNSKLIILATAAVSLACAQELQHTQEPTNLQHVQFDVRSDEPQAASGVATASTTSDHVFIMSGPGPMPAMAMGERMSLGAVKGAPYSAEAVTESVQTLADGNRISSKQSTKQYRDSEGRTRTETTIAPNAMWVPENKSMTFINIMDPVNGESYTLNSAEKVATKMSMPKAGTMSAGKAMMRSHETSTTVHFEADGAGGGAGVAGAMITGGAAGEGPAVMTFESRAGSLSAVRADMPKNLKTEELGKQVVEGVECIGIRTTITIPAGQIGNERALEMVTERWSSPELGFDVLRKHSDPRNGETTYKLTNIVRGEQPRSLFEVPADYKLNDFSTETMRKKMTIKMRDAAPENQ